MRPRKIYDVAFSFAGEDRGVARQLAQRLRTAGYKVFFDEFEKAALWGKDLTVKLEDVYQNLARFCVMLISRCYAEKPWTTHERRAALSRAFREKTAYILPIRLDDTSLPGFPDVLGYVDLRSVALSEVYNLLSVKLGLPSCRDDTQQRISAERVREVLAACYRRAVFARLHAQIDLEAMFKSLSDCRVMLQKLAVFVEPATLQRLMAGIIGELDFIERRRAAISESRLPPAEEFQIDGAKLRIIASLLELRKAAGISFELPTSVTEEAFFTQAQGGRETEFRRLWRPMDAISHRRER
jgi:hypothetical protein